MALATMRVLTPHLRDGVMDWMTYRAKIPRPFTLFVKHKFGREEVMGAEIGFGYGLNTVNILEELNVARLYCIDPLEPYIDKFGNRCVGYLDMAKSYYPELSKSPKVRFLRMTSDTAFKTGMAPDNLDFVYVDGLHTVEQAYRDIVNGLKHVKVGGVVGGHDFSREYEDTVLPAVFRVSAETGMVPTVDMPDFWFIKDAISEK